MAQVTHHSLQLLLDQHQHAPNAQLLHHLTYMQTLGCEQHGRDKRQRCKLAKLTMV